jgi:hypothetical protein
MPRLTVDLTEAQSNKPVPDDTYEAKVASFEGPTQGPKSTYITAIIEITEGDFAGRKFYHNLPINGKGAGILADFVSKTTGEDIDVDDLESLDLDTDDLVGAEIAIVTRQSEYPEGSGEMRSEIKKILPNS